MKNNNTTPEMVFAVNPDLFTQLIGIDDSTFHICSRLFDFTYCVELFTNVKLRKKDLSMAFDSLNKRWRYIINNQVRYQQRIDNLPPDVGIRFYGAKHEGHGWYNPSLKFCCNNPVIIEFIIRAWCERSNQFPRELTICFKRESHARKCMSSRYISQDFQPNIRKTLCGSSIVEDYHISDPYRLAYYMAMDDVYYMHFGYTAFIFKTAHLRVPQAGFIYPDEQQRPCTIEDIYIPQGLRSYQVFGNNKSTSNKLVKKRVVPRSGGNLAHKYYKTCKAGHLSYNTYIHQRLKKLDTYEDTPHALHQLTTDRLMATLRDAVDEIERLRAIIKEKNL